MVRGNCRIRAYLHYKIEGGLVNTYNVVYVIRGMLPNYIVCVFETTLTLKHVLCNMHPMTLNIWEQ